VDASVSACDNNATDAVVDLFANLFFEVTNVATQMDLEWKIACSQELANTRFALSGASATGGWIQEQVNSLGWHLPMLQCRGLFPQNGLPDVGTWR
jgi:hypothetical protein